VKVISEGAVAATAAQRQWYELEGTTYNFTCLFGKISHFILEFAAILSWLKIELAVVQLMYTTLIGEQYGDENCSVS